MNAENDQPNQNAIPESPEARGSAMCKHDGMRNAVTYPVCPRSFTQRKMVWCSECGNLLHDDTWEIPLPPETESPNNQAQRLGDCGE